MAQGDDRIVSVLFAALMGGVIGWMIRGCW